MDHVWNSLIDLVHVKHCLEDFYTASKQRNISSRPSPSPQRFIQSSPLALRPAVAVSCKGMGDVVQKLLDASVAVQCEQGLPKGELSDLLLRLKGLDIRMVAFICASRVCDRLGDSVLLPLGFLGK